MKYVVCLLFLFVAQFCFAEANATSKIEMEVAKVYMQAFPTISITSISVTPTIPIEPPFTNFAYIDNTTIIPTKERGQFNAVFKTNNGEAKRIIFRYTIDASIEACKTKTPLARDQMIGQENIEQTFLRLGLIIDMPLTQAQAVNQYVKRFMPKGTILLARDIGGQSAIKKGQTVTISYSQGLIEADMDTIALEDGQIGQIISVKNKTGNILRVKVAGKDRAILE